MNKKVTRKRIVLASVIIAFALTFIVLTNPCCQMSVMFLIMGQRNYQMQVRLLCRTDHQALLEACREVLRRRDLQIGRSYRIDGDRCHPEVSSLPQPILDLAPCSIRIEKMLGGEPIVQLLMGTSADHFGVYAYPEDYEPPFERFHYGDKQLVPGLWYCDERYVDNPGYDKRIEALLKKRKQAH